MYMDIHEFITEAKRVTRKGGKITITVPNPQTPWSRFIKMMGMKIWTDNLSGGGINYIRLPNYVSMVN